MRTRAWLFFCLAIVGLKFALFGLDPAPKLYMGDSGSYIYTAVNGWIPSDRSFAYGYVIRWVALWTHSLSCLVIFQVALSAITALVFAWICRFIFRLPEWCSFLFGLLCALDPLQLLYERYVMTEAVSLFLYAFAILHSFLYLRSRRLRDLIIFQVAGVLLIGFRMSFLLAVQVNTVLLPFIAYGPELWERFRRRSAREASFVRPLKACLIHLLVSVLFMALLHTGYKRLNGRLSVREPAYLYTTGVTLFAFWAPVLQPEDASDPRVADLIRKGDEFGLRVFDYRNSQRFLKGRLVDRLFHLEPDPARADQLAKSTALHALRRDPLAILAIAWRTYAEYWSPEIMIQSAELDFGFHHPPSKGSVDQLAALFHFTYPPGPGVESPIQYYYLSLWPYFFVILLAPFLAALALCLRFGRPYAFLLFVHSSILLTLSMMFGSDSVRYLQPISFLTLLIFALGAKAAWERVRKNRQGTIVEALEQNRVPIHPRDSATATSCLREGFTG